MSLKKTNNGIIKWLRVAIDSEKSSLHDYLEYANLSHNNPGKNMFIKLARDEYQHMTVLEKELNRIQKGQAWHPVKLPPSQIEQVIPKLKKNILTMRLESDENEVEALSLALKAEKRAMSFYFSKSQSVNNPKAKSLLERLANMENAHYQILQAELDNINKTGFWMDFSEMSLEAV